MLFNNCVNQTRKDTSFAYGMNYYSYSKLSLKQKNLIYWTRHVVMTKSELILNCDENLVKLYLSDVSSTDQGFNIHWENNNVPTEAEFNKFDADRLFRVEFRISPVVADNGRVALISAVN